MSDSREPYLDSLHGVIVVEDEGVVSDTMQ